MRWAYKTIHYGLKKDGLLGGTFLDENEIEESLNEYGESGWELVSLLEVRDGVIAVFKASIDEYQQHHAPVVTERNQEIEDLTGDFELEKESYQADKTDLFDGQDEVEVEAETGEKEIGDLNRDIGSIRIE